MLANGRLACIRIFVVNHLEQHTWAPLSERLNMLNNTAPGLLRLAAPSFACVAGPGPKLPSCCARCARCTASSSSASAAKIASSTPYLASTITSPPYVRASEPWQLHQSIARHWSICCQDNMQTCICILAWLADDNTSHCCRIVKHDRASCSLCC